MKRALRVAVVHLLYGVGLLQLLTWVVLRRRAVVLTYHRVLPDDVRAQTWSQSAIIVSCDTFERHMRVLRRHFRVLSPAAFEECMRRGQFEPRSCLVTFDDGWIDTYTEAWPVLQRYRIPALVFLPSAYIGTGDVFWQERLGRVLYTIRQRVRYDAAFAETARPALSALGLDSVLEADEAAARGVILDLVRQTKSSTAQDPAATVRALEALAPEAAGATAHIDRYIDWAQAREMARDGVTFGAHSDTHRPMTTLPADEARREIEVSRQALRQQLGTTATAFCYPNGDWNPEVAAAVAQARFSMAFSTDRGRIDRDSNPFALRRVNVHEDMTHSTPMFLARLIGVV
jgi:peptidoglycan/xylan/chitin deacetylase (PgdA/CDA1 family)